jgi:adenylate cyclase
VFDDGRPVAKHRPEVPTRGARLILQILDSESAYRPSMEPAPELSAFMERFLGYFAAFDAERVIDGLSREPGALTIGTAADEWWEGRDTMAAAVRVQFHEMPPVHFEIEKIDAFKEATVGWVATRATMLIEGMPSRPIRMSLVAHEEGAFWRAVHWHVSMPVENEVSLGVELTTGFDELLTMAQDESLSGASLASDGSVAIMFTDVEGSTALMEALGEDKWLELLAWHNGSVRQQVTLFGGTVVKGQGDGFMIAFPAVGSAAACAVAIQRNLSAGWQGNPVAVRIGLHSGNAKVEAGDFFGRTVIVAARLAGAAAGGEILASDIVQSGLSGAFPVGASRSISAKGISGQFTVFPLVWT